MPAWHSSAWGLIGKSRQRDRRPTPDEIKRLPEYFEDKRHLMIPMGRIVRFAIAGAMRQEEICRTRWSEVNVEQHVVLVRARKEEERYKPRSQARRKLTADHYRFVWQ